MKIIFLDFDGVINNSATWTFEPYGSYRDDETGRIFRIPTDPACMTRLNRLIKESGAYVVISSSWRNFACWQDLYPALKNSGFEGIVIGETPSLHNDTEWLAANRWGKDHHERIDRGHEIDAFLERHKDPFSFKEDGFCLICQDSVGDHGSECQGHVIEEFVILDDCSDMAHLKPWFVHTQCDVGLDDPDVERALWLLPQSRSYTEHPL